VAIGGGDWPAELLSDVAAVRSTDFELRGGAARDDLDASLDLLAVAVRP
jgi:hypothetical protein